MTGQVLELDNVITPDLLATRLTERYIEWESLRQVWKNEKEEVRRYIYATDTSQTSNTSNPWKNRTTIPKLCQIRDNLYSNYTATLFPKRKWLTWDATSEEANETDKINSIVNYMAWTIDQPSFKHELDKIILDYIDYGNCFATVEWTDQRIMQGDKTQVGYVGPSIRRINPLDIVVNPTAENFISSPKFIRSIMSMGELKKMLEKMSNDENREAYQELYDYLREIRFRARTFQGDWSQRDRIYDMDGFSSFRTYLRQDYVEVLTYYGDWYDYYTDEYQENRVIMVVDRHKLISNQPNASFFGYAPIYHVPWRKRQDNLYGMGPLDNLVGMQYRLDHTENEKADILDLSAYPVQKVKGFVEDFTWQPAEKIFVSDEGDVELLQPDIQIQQLVQDMAMYMNNMEEMAGAPKEAMGFRSPGEKTAFEVQRLENAASRLFQNKINQFEEQIVEPLLNAMLELARRNMTGTQVIPVFDNDFKITTFQNLTVQDITGIGRIRPVAARHFAEQAELVQNLGGLSASGMWQTVAPHFSSVTLAKIYEEVFNLKDYNVVIPFIQLAEQADAQRQAQALQEQLHQEIGTATGMGQDFDLDRAAAASQPTNNSSGLQRNPAATATPTGTLGVQ